MSYDANALYRTRRPVATRAKLESYIARNAKAYFDPLDPNHDAVVKTARQLARGPAAAADAEAMRIYGRPSEDGHVVVGPPRGGVE